MAGVLEYSSTAASNTTLNGIGIAGSNSVKNGDDALRQLMADTASAITKVVDKSGTYTALKADYNQMIRATGTLTLNLTAAATLTAGWCLWVKGDGGAVTVDPNSSEQINGATTLVLADGFSAFIVCTGTAFRAVVVGNGDVTLTGTQTLTNKTLTSPTINGGTWTGGTDLAIADGGTGRSSHTAYAVLCGGTTATGAQQSIASVGSSGQVLTSNGAAALPTFQTLTIDYGAGNAALAVGDVGTWAYLMPATGGSATYAPGSTLAGASLTYAGSQFSGGTTRGTSPSGTWRCMGQSARNTTDANCYSTAWLRIS
jgi:hypothetical protein